MDRLQGIDSFSKILYDRPQIMRGVQNAAAIEGLSVGDVLEKAVIDLLDRAYGQAVTDILLDSDISQQQLMAVRQVLHKEKAQNAEG